MFEDGIPNFSAVLKMPFWKSERNSRDTWQVASPRDRGADRDRGPGVAGPVAPVAVNVARTAGMPSGNPWLGNPRHMEVLVGSGSCENK